MSTNFKLENLHRKEELSKRSRDSQSKSLKSRGKKKSHLMCGAIPRYQHKDCPVIQNVSSVRKLVTMLRYIFPRRHSIDCKSNNQYNSMHSPRCNSILTHMQGDEFVDYIISMTIHMLKTARVKSINCPQSNPHIRPTQLSLQPNSPIQKLNCEVDTGAECNVLPYNIHKPATVHIIACDDNTVEVMGSCIIHAQSGKTVCKLECQVNKTEGYFFLGRDTDVKMNYVNFPEAKPPHNLALIQVVSQKSATRTNFSY